MEAPMARRAPWKTLLTGGLAAAAVGCGGSDKGPNLFNLNRSNNGPQVTPDPAFQAPTPPPARSGLFGGDSSAKTKAGKSSSGDTLVALADVGVESAFTDGRAPADRDQLLDNARQQYQKALKLDPKCKGAYLGLATIHTKLEEFTAAAAVYKQYLGQFPKDHAVQHELAVVYGKAQDWSNAIVACEAAIAVDPENRVYQKTLGMCLVRAGRYDEGFVAWRKVMPECKARFFLARALEHTGQTELVKQQVQLALAADPTYEPAKEFLAYLNGEQPTPPALDAVQQTAAIQND
jgi:tetratricopeptide (TPR) repeat protein